MPWLTRTPTSNKESCVARYSHAHLSPDFTIYSQDFISMEAKRFDDYTVVIVSGNTEQRRCSLIYTREEVKLWEIKWEWQR